MYSEAQLDLYFAHIGYPRDVHSHAPNPLALLTELQRRTLARVPFESISLHYSKHRLLSLDLEDLFRKIVENGHGGYCMELNAFFGAILQSLGFTLFGAGARVKKGPLGFASWDHMVNIVTVDHRRYLVDVGFGSNCPTQPLPLEDGLEADGIAPFRHKLQYRNLEQHTDPTQRSWVLSRLESPGAEWQDQYAFTEVEFFPGDFEVMNLTVMTSPRSYFVQTVLASILLPDETSGELTAVLTLHKNEVKKRVGDRTELLEELKTEEQRVKALQKYFHILLTPEEQRAIRWLPSEIK